MRATAEALQPLLDQGWMVRHDLAWPGRPRASIDYVAIGQAGVFVIERVAWAGDVDVRDGVLLHNGRSRAGAVDEVAEAVQAVSRAMGGVPVTGVLCLAGNRSLAEPHVDPSTQRARSRSADDVLVCTTGDLAATLSARPATLHGETSNRYISRAAVTLFPAADSRRDTAASGHAADPDAVRRAGSLDRLVWVLVLAALVLALIVAAVLAGPSLVSSLR